jgi:hypothetical protein
MRAIVVYESMFGNTRKIAEAIAEGIGGDTAVVAVAFVTRHDLHVDLLVVGGPTHAHSMSRFATRKSAEDRVQLGRTPASMDKQADITLGVREWLYQRAFLGMKAAAFDTRVNAPSLLTGRASRGIARLLKGDGATLIAPPTSFLVTKDDELVAGELERARAFGKMLAEQFTLTATR